MEAIAFNPASFAAFLGFIGPLIVGALTGLKTSGKVKAVIGAVIVTLFAVVQAYLQGGITEDIFASILVVIAIWQSSYSGFWKPLGMTEWLQDKVPVAIGQVTEVLEDEFVDAGTPEQTDNSTKVDDGIQDVTQDPGADMTEGEEIPEEV